VPLVRHGNGKISLVHGFSCPMKIPVGDHEVNVCCVVIGHNEGHFMWRIKNLSDQLHLHAENDRKLVDRHIRDTSWTTSLTVILICPPATEAHCIM
jgi:hypothetical protein